MRARPRSSGWSSGASCWRATRSRLPALSSQTDTKTLIETAISHFLTEVPALAPLSIVVGLELHGRADTQLYRVQMPGPKVTKEIAPEAKITLSVQRATFNELATKGHLAEWRAAFEHGDAKATGIDQYLQLIKKVVEAREERSQLRRAKH